MGGGVAQESSAKGAEMWFTLSSELRLPHAVTL